MVENHANMGLTCTRSRIAMPATGAMDGMRTNNPPAMRPAE
ncbi:hypothetical protein FHR96_003127 [Halomonas organivorans]|uniref:Uncharacterized protein n=1 Tax=Halomonas organivorans TaxID=257772 RepID=A0A7W5BZV4_9GAMM|nr:hypothetical protein [Halomonas organivorans]